MTVGFLRQADGSANHSPAFLPRLHHLLGIFIARFWLLRRRSYRTSAGCGTVLTANRRRFRIVQRINQRMNAVHPAWVPSSSMAFLGSIQWGGGVARDSSEKTGFNISGFIYAEERGWINRLQYLAGSSAARQARSHLGCVSKGFWHNPLGSTP